MRKGQKVCYWNYVGFFFFFEKKNFDSSKMFFFSSVLYEVQVLAYIQYIGIGGMAIVI